jgi:flagellar hook-basal body complex protein FliE
MIRGVSGMSAYGAAAASAARSAMAPTGAVGAAKGTESFGDTLQAGLNNVEAVQRSSESALSLLASGEQVDLHGTMIELEKADIALRTMVSVRDKVITAYEQVMNMSV